jgi:RNA ligase (TIGR02306 family)
VRKLATVQIIDDIQPVPDSDRLDVATVRGWKVVCGRGEYKPGDRCVYVEIDAFLPVRPEFEFLRKTSFKKMGELEGFRLKSVRLRGTLSQGLLLSPDLIPDGAEIGDDLSEHLGIVLYEPPIPAELAGVAKGHFPSFLVKTDEERIQNLSRDYERLRGLGPWVATEKLDGSSATYYWRDGQFGVCSRNLELVESEGNTFWRVARELDLEGRLRDGYNLCVQGELIGPGIQGNPYRLAKHEFRAFNIWNIDDRVRLGAPEFQDLCRDLLGVETVPILNMAFELPPTVSELLELADGQSELASVPREGLVLRTNDYRYSFKVISNSFLMRQ